MESGPFTCRIFKDNENFRSMSASAGRRELIFFFANTLSLFSQSTVHIKTDNLMIRFFHFLLSLQEIITAHEMFYVYRVSPLAS